MRAQLLPSLSPGGAPGRGGRHEHEPHRLSLRDPRDELTRWAGRSAYLMGDRATKILGELHDWMARENATIMAVICLIIGAKLIGDAITALAS